MSKDEGAGLGPTLELLDKARRHAQGCGRARNERGLPCAAQPLLINGASANIVLTKTEWKRKQTNGIWPFNIEKHKTTLQNATNICPRVLAMNQTKTANKVPGRRPACQAWPDDGGDQGTGARGSPWDPVTHPQRAPGPAVVATWGLVSLGLPASWVALR